MNKSDRIRRLLAKDLSVSEIAKRLKVKPNLVHQVKWADKKKKPPKIVKAVKEMKQALIAVDDTGKTILNETGKIKEGTRIGGLTLRKLPGDMWTWKKETKEDLVNKPPHYTTGGVETLDFIEAKDLNYRLGNVVKYVVRCGKKNTDPVQDLEKAMFYLKREIEARRNA